MKRKIQPSSWLLSLGKFPLCLLLALCLFRPNSLNAQSLAEPQPTPAPIAMDQLGAVAGKQYHGDGLSITATPAGARLRCAFQRLEGQATDEGLWLSSTEADAAGERFRVVAVEVGRTDDFGVRRQSAAATPLWDGDWMSGAIADAESGVALCFPPQSKILPVQGSVSANPQSVRFTRAGLTEEYSVSVDGVRQDFIVDERPAGDGELRVELAVTGASVAPLANGARLKLSGSERKLAYTRLRVSDAGGRELTARIEVASADRMAVVVDDTAANYPVRIDPTFSDADWISIGGYPGAQGNVNAAVLDGSGNLYIGGFFTIVGDTNANYVAKWNGSSWSALGLGMNSTVLALAVSGDNVYAGGYFTTAGGVAASRIAQWNGSSWSAMGSGMNGVVQALAVSGSDVYAGGYFTTAGGSASNYVAKWNGSSWSALGSGMNSGVQALAVSGSDVYAGGSFTNAGGMAANHIAKWNGSSWSALGSGINGGVSALAVSGSDVYAGGYFTTAGGSAASCIAKWNGSSWSALGLGMDSTVLALAVSGSDVYAGGVFATAGGSAAHYIAKWNGSSWTAVGSAFNELYQSVQALAVSESDVYAGIVGGSAANGVANGVSKWNGSNWSALGSVLNSYVYALAVSGSDVYAGGAFTTAGASANYVAKWNGSSWSALGLGMDSTVWALAVSGSNVYAGGYFTTAGGSAANYVAKWNGSSWSALGSGMNGEVLALAVSGSDVYAGGAFTTAGGMAANYIAKWNGSSWSVLGSGMNGGVSALAVSGSDVYAGGAFTTAGGMAANYIAKWNGSSWSALGSGINGGVSALAVSGSDVYAGGYFTTAGGSAASCIAKWNGSSWSRLDYGTESAVSALAVSGSDVYAGGRFTTAGRTTAGLRRPANYIAKWDGSSWAALGSGMDNYVNALAVSGSTLYAGGNFTTAGGKVSRFAAKASLPVVSPQIIIQPGSQTVAVGDSVVLSVAAVGEAPLLYQWRINDVVQSGATNSDYHISSATTNDAGSYSVVISNSWGSATSSNAMLSVLPLVVSTQPISFNQSTQSSISVMLERDDWTFWGRAGQTVAVVVESGGTNVIAPKLDFAEVRLVDPSSNILARGSNNVAGQTVVLTNILLPVDGTYRVHVRAPANQPVAIGNYRLTLWETTPDVSSLLLNVTTYGRIKTPYSVEQWNFSALAGQQVKFDLINTAAPGLVFDLRGPVGWVGFTNLANDSGLVNLPANGNYILTARGTGGSADNAYAFQLVETTQTDLPLGTNYMGQFTGSGQAQIFKITVTNAGPLRISLMNFGAGNNVQLYSSRITPPTRGSFEFQSVGPGSSQELLIPSASVGDLYILVYGDSIPTPGQFTIRASAPGVVLTGGTPDKQLRNSSFAMRLTGAGFEPGDAVELVASGGSPIYAATNVSLDTYSQLTAVFPPTISDTGTYSVRVRQVDGDSATLTNLFEILPPKVFPALPGYDTRAFKTRLIQPGTFGRHAVATIYVEYANEGNASMPAPLLVLKSADADDSDRPGFTMDQSRIVQNYWSPGLPPGTANEVFILASGAQPGVLNPGERIQVPVYYLGLQQPWDFSDTQVEMEIRYWLADDSSSIDWAARKESLRPPTLDSNTWDVVYANLTGGLATMGDYIGMLNDNAQFLGRLGQHVTDVDKLWNFELQQAWGYSPIPVLDSVTDASLPAPGVSLDISRRFSANVRARNSTGLFGYGWFTPWQSQLVVEDGGDLVRLVGEAGSASVFTRDTRTSVNYFSGVGNSSQLVAVGGGVFELRSPNGTVTRFRPDGLTDYVQDVNGNRVTAGYNGAGKITSLTHTSGGSITMSYNGAGLISKLADSAGRTNTYTYSGSYLQTVTTSDGKVTSYTYETGGNNAQRHALTSITRGGTTRSFTFDTRGRMESTFVAGGEQLVNFTYDSAGGVYVADATGTSALFSDHNGLLAKTQDPLGNVTISEFDSDLRRKRLVLSTGESQSFTWCSCGSPTSITDELGYTTRFAYDNPFRRLTGFIDARGNTTSYTYDVNGNLLKTIYQNSSVEEFGGYTPNGLPLSHTNRRNQAVTYIHTSAGQLFRQSFTNGSFNEFHYDLRGNLTNVVEHPETGPDKFTSYLYDYATAGDRLRKVTYPNARWVEFFYDGFGRRSQMTDVTGQDLRYDYDAAGRLWRLRDTTNAVIVEYLYNASGRLERINKGNSTYTTYDYDAAGQILHLLNHALSGSVNSHFDYTYDKRGRRTAMGTVDGDWTYDYDGTGQLIRARLASANPQISNQDLQYNYDALGNRISTVTNGVQVDYTANNLNQYTTVGGVAFEYDADGNMTFDGMRSYDYDVQNRLANVTGPEGVTEYEYDAVGNRTATLSNGQRTDYLLDPSGLVNVIAEHDGSGGLLVRSVNALGLVSQSEGAGAMVYYFDFDAIGSTADVTEGLGSVLSRYSFTPFGSLLGSTGIVASPHEFVGQLGVRADVGSLSFMRSRFYHESLARFTVQDPIGLAGRDVNLYRYVANSSPNAIDPIGLFSASGGGSFFLPNGLGGSLSVSTEGDGGGCVSGAVGFGTPGGGLSTGGSGSLDSGSLGFTWDILTFSGSTPFGSVDISVGTGGSSVGWSAGTGKLGLGVSFTTGGTYCWSAPDGTPSEPSVPSKPGAKGDGKTSNSVDPNEKFGAGGGGLENWMRGSLVIPYRINFENLGPGSVDGNGNPFPSVATAPAQEVVITDQLSTNLDWQTFELSELGFGDVIIPVPPGLQYFESSVVMTCCGDPFQAQVQAGLNPVSGEVRVVFSSINPASSLPPVVSVGFLPPEDGTGRGKGHVSYMINTKTNLTSGTQIRNVALITFDRQQTIATDQIDPQNPGAGIDPNKQALNTIDAGAPTSSVAALPAESGRAFIVHWSGQDDTSGSGIASYDVYASTNAGPFGLWLGASTNTANIFHGELSSSYAFYSLARDLVGNLELPPLAPDTQTTVSTNSPVLATVTNQIIPVGLSLNFTNLVLQGTPTGEYRFTVLQGPFGATVNATNGTFQWTPSCEQGSSTNQVIVWVTDSGQTNLSDAAIFELVVRECLRPQVGTLVLPAGGTGTLPIYLYTSQVLTNIALTVALPEGKLTATALESVIPEICTNSLIDLGHALYEIRLAACAAPWLQPTQGQHVAWLYLEAASNQSSAFVYLNVGNSIGTQPDGTMVTNYVTQTARAVIVGEEPLLEAVINTNKQPALVLYALTGTTNTLESATNPVPPILWQSNQVVIMTNLQRIIQPIALPEGQKYFRAWRP